MQMFFSNYGKHIRVLCLAACMSLTSCNTGTVQLAGGGIGGTGITSGTVTGFGSVFVNGVEFDTTGATRSIDDVVTISNGVDDSTVMGSGMVVTITGTVNPDGITGSATSITYDEIVSGPVKAAPVEDPDRVHKTFGILDLTITVDRNITIFVNTDYLSLQMNDVLDVSGFFDDAGTLVATRLENTGVFGQGTIVETRGTVSGFNGIDTFTIGTLSVTFDGGTIFENLPGSVTDGQYVEVNGVLQGTDSIHASRIQREDSGLGNFSGDVSVEGIVTSFTDIGNFRLDGVPVDASNATFNPVNLAGTLANNQRIEVEGTVAAGMISADSVEQRGGKVKLAGQVTATDVSSGTFSLEIVAGQPPVAVMVDARTQLEDELLQLKPFTLQQVNAGDPVLVQGYLDNTGMVIAGEVKRRLLDEHELAGPVSVASGNASSGSVTILGVTMSTDNRTEFEDGNNQPFPNGGDDFYNQVSPGDIVGLEDEVPVDGVADEVEFRN
jgi:hypothetical protein